MGQDSIEANNPRRSNLCGRHSSAKHSFVAERGLNQSEKLGPACVGRSGTQAGHASLAFKDDTRSTKKHKPAR